jgi:3-methyladenine DNA glycosylase/8-oxoguanine DNA glycosylase
MPSVFQLRTPEDFLLPRDLCSYGYFLLWPNHWDVRSHVYTRALDLDGAPALLRITQPKGSGTALRVASDRTLTPSERSLAKAQITRILRLDDSAAALARFHLVDPRWAATGRGRLMRSATLFEDVLKTVTSCNVTWPSTVVMNRRLCEVVGRRAADAGAPVTHTFPTARKLARTRPATLRSRCRVGYRDARMVELARLFTLPVSRGGIDVAWFENPATPDDAIRDALLDLPGIGPYAAANILQLLGRYAHLPLDTESVRHGRTVLNMTGSSAKIMKDVHAHFAPFGADAFRSYWFELWAFYERKNGPSWTWERDSTGKMFTAAVLNKD